MVSPSLARTLLVSTSSPYLQSIKIAVGTMNICQNNNMYVCTSINFPILLKYHWNTMMWEILIWYDDHFWESRLRRRRRRKRKRRRRRRRSMRRIGREPNKLRFKPILPKENFMKPVVKTSFALILLILTRDNKWQWGETCILQKGNFKVRVRQKILVWLWGWRRPDSSPKSRHSLLVRHHWITRSKNHQINHQPSNMRWTSQWPHGDHLTDRLQSRVAAGEIESCCKNKYWRKCNNN